MITEAILIGLAAFRMAHFLVEEDGPFDVAWRLRNYLAPPEKASNKFFPQLFSCIWCMSVWTVLVSGILWLIEPTAVMLIAAMSIAVLPSRFT